MDTSKKQILLEFREHGIRDKSVLIVEPNECHGETLPGFTKYFQDLGYCVDIFMRTGTFNENPFSRYPQSLYPNIYKGCSTEIKNTLASPEILEYDYVFFNSNWEYAHGKTYTAYLGFFPQAKFGSMFVEHGAYFFQKNECNCLYGQERVFALTDALGGEMGIKTLSPHYFGDVRITKKSSDEVRFAVVGVSPDRRNVDLLLDAVDTLTKGGVENFRITCIGDGRRSVPKGLGGVLNFLGRQSFSVLYEEVEKADFILALLDPSSENHRNYLRGKASGTVQLSLGFGKPMIIEEHFAEVYGFNNENCLLYRGNELASTMKNAIEMSQGEYCNIQHGLKDKKDDLGMKSINNLRRFLVRVKELDLRTKRCAELIDSEMNNIRDDINRMNRVVYDLNREITFMRSSRFWKMRCLWNNVKVFVSSPAKFIRKYFKIV